MQVESDRQRELLDVERLLGICLSRAACSRCWPSRDRLFPAALFADLFPRCGSALDPGRGDRPVIVLQALYGHSGP